MKKAISVLLALIMILPILTCLVVPITAQDSSNDTMVSQPLYTRKVVSVVYDDSGSMGGREGEKWAYANYAMQSFCGMLNSEDQLYITYMSTPGQSEEKGLTSNMVNGKTEIQQTIDSIREHNNSSGTPFQSVRTAYNKLKEVASNNKDATNIQYWLVVITDGEFTDGLDKTLDEEFTSFADDPLWKDDTNGTQGPSPQVTFLGIGENVSKPTENPGKGIYSYSTKNATEIENRLSELADKISGRSRLDTNSDNIEVDGKTLKVSSKVPLLNVVIFTKQTDAVVQKMTTKESDINVSPSRSASLFYSCKISGENELIYLTGGTFLLGDSKSVMNAGTYEIIFDKEIEKENVVVLVEPALEIKIEVSVNGIKKETSELKDYLMAKDKISVSYKLYEMGTGEEVDLSMLPETTEYKINVYKGGKLDKTVSGKNQMLENYELEEVDTLINATVTIEGFIVDYTLRFKPAKYTPRTVYKIHPTVSSTEPILSEKISENEGLFIAFTVSKMLEVEGSTETFITNPEELKALNPIITVSPSGNDGETVYTPDGKIVFTPKSAGDRQNNKRNMDVTVTCTLENGTTATEKYTVHFADYKVVFVASDQKIRKTELYQNEISAIFYVTRDGEKMSKEDVDGKFTFTLNEERKDLKTNVSVADDGIITITPYSEIKHEKSFLLTYWMHYLALVDDDITISLEHELASGVGTLDVIGGGGAYVFLNVLLWLIIEILVVLAIVAYIFRFITKPRFDSKAKIYYGKIESGNGTCILNMNHRVRMKGNRIKNRWNPFKPLTVDLMGASFIALYGGMVLFDKPYFEARVIPAEGNTKTGRELYEMCKSKGREIEIQPIIGPKSIERHLDRGISNGAKSFYVFPKEIKASQGTEITEGYAFCYVIEDDSSNIK